MRSSPPCTAGIMVGTVSLHPQEALPQQARALQHSQAFSGFKKRRRASEHRIARLVQLGLRQVRYFGRTKTLVQLLQAATVADLTLVARAMGMMHWPRRRAITLVTSLSRRIRAGLKTFLAPCGRLPASSRSLYRLKDKNRPQCIGTFHAGTFRPDF